jgi:hypothetical protein
MELVIRNTVGVEWGELVITYHPAIGAGGHDVVKFLPGDGYVYYAAVSYISDFPRGHDGTCAFCNGDPLAEGDGKSGNIGMYLEFNEDAEFCPICQGRPS